MEAPEISGGGFELLRPFVEAARALWRQELDDEQRWRKIAELMPLLLDSEPLRDKSDSWPAPAADHTRAQNLLFYEDPDYHFVINGLIKNGDEITPIHDHAHTWTVYGVLTGHERVVRFKRLDEAAQSDRATLDPIDDYVVAPGYVDLVPPGLLHAEYAGGERTVAIIVRSERVGDFPQTMIDPATHAVTHAPGPAQLRWQL